MGINSSKKKSQLPTQSQASCQTPGKTLKDTKKVLLLHKSDTKEQELIVRNFRDALRGTAEGSIKVEKMVNIANTTEIQGLQDAFWLDEINNVVLFCLKSEAISLLEQIIKEKKYAQDGRLHEKVFTVSFGGALSHLWPPSRISNGSEHARDFAFNFEDVDSIKPNDFENSDKMAELIRSLKGT